MIFSLLAANADVTALIGAPPAMRCYNSGNAPEFAPLPYVTHESIGGAPQVLLSASSNFNAAEVSVTVWAATALEARTLMRLVRDALEDNGSNVSVSTPRDSFDSLTKRYAWTWEVLFWASR